MARYTNERKAELIALASGIVATDGATIGEAARMLGVPVSTLRGWLKAAPVAGATELRRVETPGKYEGGLAIDEHVHALTLDSGADEECGSVQEQGWFGLVRGPIKLHGNTDVTPYEWAYLASVAGAIVFEDSDGFVNVDYFDDVDTLDDRWGCILEAYASEEDGSDDSEEDGSDDIEDVDIPSEFVELASQWYSGQDDLLYAVASTGGLTLGSRCPYDSDAGRSLTDREWHLQLFNGLSCDVRHAAKSAKGANHEDATALEAFEAWVDSECERLRTAYGLTDSDVV